MTKLWREIDDDRAEMMSGGKSRSNAGSLRISTLNVNSGGVAVITENATINIYNIYNITFVVGRGGRGSCRR